MNKYAKDQPGTLKLIDVGSVIQANEKAGNWAYCLLTVTEVKSFGVQAYTRIPMQGDAYIRLPWEAIEYIGEAQFVRKE